MDLVKTMGMADVVAFLGGLTDGQMGQEDCSLHRYTWEIFLSSFRKTVMNILENS